MTDVTSSKISETVTVNLGDRSYDILIGSGLLDSIGEHIVRHLRQKRVFIVTEKTVHQHQGARLTTALKTAGINAEWFILPSGEATKSFAQFEKLTTDLLAAGIERSDVILAFGGGVIGDLAGFAAASILRGIDFIQVPTTLLSQVDSSVGGKTGINTVHGKNLVGAFYQPRQVVIDITTLETLTPRDMRAGYAEVVKYGLIDDPVFFEWLEQNGPEMIEGDDLEKSRSLRTYAVAHSCRAKARIVSEDERENGRRALLNLGHTFGHALEAECGYGDTLLHGEAVAIGMVMALDASSRLGMASDADMKRLRQHLKLVGMPSDAAGIPRVFEAETLLNHMFKDKKVEAGNIGFILGSIGNAQMKRGVDLDIIRSVLHDSINAT